MSQSINLISLGRAHTLQILQTVRDRSSIPSPTLGGEQDFQNGIRLKYEQIKFPSYRPITYVEDYSHAQRAPEFVLLERLPGMPRPDYKFTLAHGGKYSLIQSFQAPVWSGSDMFLYQRESPGLGPLF
jgi:hypothetical protein